MRQRFFAKFATFGKEAGSGLGTYTAKLFTQAMRGSIEMQTSDLDDSTTLTVRLPRNR
jgi:signal transduction histidine kinase